MAYVYRHLRKDTNEVFYIGIGSDKKYSRANSVGSRNRYWKFIVAKVGHAVEIIEDNLTWEEACELEKYWIKFYGRKDLKEGCLVNLTDGGDGTVGTKYGDDFKLKCSIASTGRKFSDATKKKISISKMGDLNPMRRPEVAKKNGDLRKGVPKKPFTAEHKANMSKSAKGHVKTPETRMKLSKANKGKLMPDSFFKKIATQVLKYDLDGNFIEEYRSLKYAASCVGGNRQGIQWACNGKNPSYRGFVWKYTEKEFTFVVTDATRIKLSIANTGKLRSGETKSKISKANKGLVRTPEQRANIAKAHPGTIILQYDLEGNFIEEYPSLRRAAASISCHHRSYIKRVCEGITQSYRGFIWKYKNQ